VWCSWVLLCRLLRRGVDGSAGAKLDVHAEDLHDAQVAEQAPLETDAAVEAPAEELPYDPFASQAHTAEIPLGGLSAAYETQPAPAVYEAEPAPEIVASAPVVEDWAAHEAADAIVREWRAG
jgi:hypothetical protein